MPRKRRVKEQWDTPEGKDVSADDLASFDWQTAGYHMQRTIVDEVRGVDDGNDKGYTPEAEDTVRDWANRCFNDHAVDPSMADERSENLNEHRGDFWQSGNSHSADAREGDGGQSDQQKKPVTRRISFRAFAVLAAVACVMCLLRFTVFNIEDIQVQGNEDVPTASILDLAGIRYGMNLLTLNERQIESRINADTDLVLSAVEKNFAEHKVVLHVRERKKASFIRYCGVIYLLDARGMVLKEWTFQDAEQEARDRGEDPRTVTRLTTPDLTQIEGLDVKNCIIGRKLILNNSTQMPVYREFMLELKVMSLMDTVSSIDLSDTDGVYLGTEDGYSVRMGSADRIHAKLRALQLVMEELHTRGQYEGTIDVSSPEVPTYIPSSAS